MDHEDNCIQEETITKQLEPVITLYTDEQIINMRNSRIGLDGNVRTLNLGSIFVTVTSYKDIKVKSSTSGTSVISFLLIVNIIVCFVLQTDFAVFQVDEDRLCVSISGTSRHRRSVSFLDSFLT